MAALSRQRALVALWPLVASACAPAPTPEWARPRVERPEPSATEGGDRRRRATAPGSTLPPATAPPPCGDQLQTGELARVSCDGERILVPTAIELHPARQVPTEPTLSVLKAVGALMRERPQIQLIRIEAYSNVGATDSEQARGEVRASQERADAVLRYLWRAQKVSAERMEAVGYGADARFAGASERWPLRIVIVQRR